jgi:SAM-dependent methyltransferase
MTAATKSISSCEVCGGTYLADFLDLGQQPLCDDLVPIGNSARVSTYPAVIAWCPTCKTAHQKYQVPKKTLFPDTYHYRGAMTKDVLDGMQELVDRVNAYSGGLAGKVVLDVGCNDGSLLQRFSRMGAVTIGVEPTGAIADATPKVDHAIKGFFDETTVGQVLEKVGQPDVITFTNVFAHIENLPALLSNLKRLLKKTTIVVIENHYLGSVLRLAQFDTFYHEHPRTYSYESFKHIAAKLDLKIAVVEFPERYNGNIRVMMASDAGDQAGRPDESGFEDMLAPLADKASYYRAHARSAFQKLVDEYGPLPAKAFPGRASILIALAGIDETQIAACYERPGSPKIGHYIPGTRIPILDETLFFRNPSAPVLVNFAWHIPREIETYMRRNGYQGRIVELYPANA